MKKKKEKEKKTLTDSELMELIIDIYFVNTMFTFRRYRRYDAHLSSFIFKHSE